MTPWTVPTTTPAAVATPAVTFSATVPTVSPRFDAFSLTVAITRRASRGAFFIMRLEAAVTDCTRRFRFAARPPRLAVAEPAGRARLDLVDFLAPPARADEPRREEAPPPPAPRRAPERFAPDDLAPLEPRLPELPEDFRLPIDAFAMSAPLLVTDRSRCKSAARVARRPGSL